MNVLERAGLRRIPGVTLVVFAVTLAMGLAQAVDGSVLTALERTSAGLHGEWWRTFTALFVQDGGLIGGGSNLLFLLVIGAAAEQVGPRWQWLAQYFGTGLICEFIGYAWQPVGGGNSIAVCGLTGAVVVALGRGQALPGYTAVAVLVWGAALLTTQWPHVWWVPVVAVVVAGVAVQVLARVPLGLPRGVGLFVLILGVVLATFANIHGPALLIGTALAALLLLTRRRLRVGADV